MYPYIHVFGRTIGTYGLMMAIAFLLVGMLSLRKAKHMQLPAEEVLIVGASAIGAGLLCGKILYIFVTYSASFLWERICAGDLSFISDGGIVFYGGLIGGVLGAIFGVRIARCQLVAIEHAVVPYIPLGHTLGRVGCFLAGCCYGRHYEGVLAVYYPNSVTGVSPEQGFFPVQLLEAAGNIVISLSLLCFERKLKRPLELLSAYLAMYAILRFVLEFFRGDEIRGIFSGLSVSQWISIALLLFSSIRLLLCRQHRAK